MHNLTIAEQIKGLKNKDFSSQELTQHYLNRIHDSKLNAFTYTFYEEALDLAKISEQKFSRKSSNFRPRFICRF